MVIFWIILLVRFYILDFNKEYNMNNKNILLIVLTTIFLFSFSTWAFIKPADEISESERRPLENLPKLSIKTLLSGEFTKDFEEYATDQFPLRDYFRSLKSFMTLKIFHQSDINGIYQKDNYLSKIEYPINNSSIDNATSKFKYIFNKYLNKDNIKTYFSIIPDKNFFMTNNQHLSFDYEVFLNKFKEQTKYMNYIDIFKHLELSDYYKTDTHWRQEKIVDVAKELLSSMDNSNNINFEKITLDVPFYGVYHGQSGLFNEPDKISYLTNDTIKNSTVYDYESESYISVYDDVKNHDKDLYGIYLSGPKSLLKITNNNTNLNKKLIIFRDSFSSSIAPLLLEKYKEIILIDIRYISSEILDKYVAFENSDVLFLYSTLILNNSITFK